MKKIMLILICASFVSTMVANEANQNIRSAKARGQPEVQPLQLHNADIFIVSEVEYGTTGIELVVAKEHPAKSPNSNGIAETAATHYVPETNKGDRKVRDVDSCEMATNYNTTDKRNALHTKTVKLPRGSVQTGSLS
jgi:hypothetical protein